jgi:hypothetical protein
MRSLMNIVKNFFPKQVQRPVGRWNIDYCSVKTNTKIDLSNEDHCGTCGEYATLRKNVLDNKIKSVVKNQSFEKVEPNIK